MRELELIGKGAEAYIYRDEKCVVKVRKEKKYRNSALDLKLRKSRTKKESTALKKCNNANIPVPKLIGVEKDKIIMERVEGVKLGEMELNEKLLEEAGELLGRIHELGICHGDYAPNNIIVCKNGMHIIDFGLCEFSTYYEKKASDLMVMRTAVKNDKLFDAFLTGYVKTYGKADKVIQRFKANAKRGRYKVRD